MTHKAPGKFHRKGLTLAELSSMFPDDAAAELWFAEQRWPEGLHCPYCGWTDVQSGAKHKTMPYRCREKECAKRFSVRTKTPMESSKLGFQVWAIALYQVTTNLKGVSSMKLHRDLGITQRSAWFLAHRIREAWKDHGAQFAGPVEVDETFIGGKEKNKHAHKKIKAGRGTVGKAIIVGAKDRETYQNTFDTRNIMSGPSSPFPMRYCDQTRSAARKIFGFIPLTQVEAGMAQDALAYSGLDV